MNNQIFENLRAIRKKQGKSLEEVSSSIGIDISSLSRVETKKSPNVSFETIYNLSRYYDISLEKLVAGDINRDHFIDEEAEEIIISKEELPYYQVVKEAKKEGLSPKETKVIIDLFRKISCAAQISNVQDEFVQLAYRVKSTGISKEKFKYMIEFLIKNEELKSDDKGVEDDEENI